MEEYLVTKEQWDAIAIWAKGHGYTDIAYGRNAGREPVGNINWYDALKFCNAASELAGLQPVYILSDGSVYRTGFCDDPVIAADGDGYRLPTSAEWEIACRAGTDTMYYWGDVLTPEHAWFTVGSTTDYSIHEVGLLKPNGYGLYDMAGNACEWCIDKRQEYLRVLRGGSVALDAVMTSAFEAVTGPEYCCYETSLRPVTDNPNAPDIDALAKASEYWGETLVQPALYPAMDDKSTALRLARALGNTEAAMRIRGLVDVGKYTEALEAYKARYIEILSAQTTHSAENYNLDPNSCSTAVVDAFPKGSRWFGEPHELHIPSPAEIAPVCAAHREEGYIQKFIDYTEDLVVRQKAEFDVLPPRLLNAKQHVPQVWKWFMGFDNSTQALHFEKALVMFCDLGDLEKFPAALVAQASLFTMQDSIHTMLKDWRFNVPNQKIHVMKIMYQLATNHPDFRLYTPAMDIAGTQLSGHFDHMIYPDGTSLEQAFNYNGSVIKDYISLRKEYPDISIPETTERKVNYLTRMLGVTMVPASDFPAVGTCGFIPPPDIRDPEIRKEFQKGLIESHVNFNSLIFSPGASPERIHHVAFPGIWPDNHRMLKCMLGDLSDPPKFTSVYFPYNAHAVIRDGFAWDNKYLFFYAPRKGSGHAVENINDIFYVDYGRPFLINAGGGSYGMLDWIDEDQRGYIHQIDEYQHSSYGRNTVLVDGTSQSRLKHGDSCIFDRYPDTAGNKYYDSEDFLYVEGNYNDGYHAGDDVHHQREIFYHKPSGVFFILDNLTGDKEHTYTQNWNIMPRCKQVNGYDVGLPGTDMTWGFADEEVIVDASLNCIYTAQKDAPNLFLYQFSAGELRYSRDYGKLDPARGWFSASLPGRRHPKTDIHTHWDAPAGTSSVLTVMASAPTDASRVASIHKFADGVISGCDIVMEDGQKLSFRFAPETVDMNGCDARVILTAGDTSVIMNNVKNSVFRNGIHEADILSPVAFEWKEEDGYAYPSYIY